MMKGTVVAARSQVSALAAAASSQASAASALAGVQRYARLDEGKGLGALASGSYGRVYVAIDKRIGSIVVVKRQQAPCDAAAKELAYYKALSQYGHANVMSLLDHFVVRSRQDVFLYGFRFDGR